MKIRIGVALASLFALTACGGAGASDYDWAAAPDAAKIAEQGKELPTYGLAPDWANYGEVVKTFCAKHNGACAHKDTDMSSSEEIVRIDAEKANPIATASDIGLMWGPVAEAKGVVPAYQPPSAAKLKDWQKGKGGWVATFVGAPAFVVNTDKVKNPPKSWADLLKPEYKGMIATKNPTSSGTGQAMVVAAAVANGGSADNLAPAYGYFKKLKDTGNLSDVKMSEETLEKGEAPIQINYDFNGIAQKTALKEKNVNVEVIIPADGSVWSPSGLIINKYNTKKGDFLKGFLEYVLSDEAQLLFAKFGARPIRALNGDLQVPAEAKANWLPESAYAPVKEIEITKVNVETILADWEAKVLA
ncbi:extracellular solute-binding protein [Nonomuraea endophytica]|uniref:Putative spermidine/putrescine transport system substrate-binding protein n=1 Tax=Nonomuraea endophytica TaxID=714136 RepID=A0A7W8EEA1_9ACTN|nr:extracellular solute-binding protein [Nonomuraea endophytica]MBB5076223.1 putative spermidine/putrescine transport system substrate-binding protein [Nonomuraea endophytica]